MVVTERCLRNHIIVLVMGSGDDPRIGLEDLVLPLRSSRILYEDLKDIILLGDPEIIGAEWSEICTFPKITVVHGDPLNRSDLRAVAIKHCAMCVVLSAWTGTSVDLALDDKAAVLATLNVKAMPLEANLTAGDGTEETEVPTTTAIREYERESCSPGYFIVSNTLLVGFLYRI